MAAGADKGAPLLFVHGDAAADHFVDIAHGECHVVQAPWAVRQLQQEQVMVAAARLGAQEDGAIDIAIGNLEIQQLAIETLGRRQILNEEHHVANVDRLRLRINRAGLIDAAHVAPLVDRRDRHLDRLLAADDEAQRHAVGIEAFQLFSHLTEAGHQRQTRLQTRQIGGRGHAPGHAAQG